MPVPVTVTNPEGKGLATHQNRSLPSSGSLFANLGSGLPSAQVKPAAQASAPQELAAQRHVNVGAADGNTIVVRGLDFKWTGDDGLPMPGPPCLCGVDLSLPAGARMLLVGSNGAGKTTLLQVLAGKHMVPKDRVLVMGQPPFHCVSLTTSGLLSYIGGNWERDIAFAGYSVPLAGDFPASQMLDSIPGASPARRRRLIEVLDIDETWRMHLVSDGQRRRVQIACGLMRPADVLLLDEITVDLDILVREDLMNFLKEESETRGCTIVYITHIFDGLESWPTHVGWLAGGKFESVQEAKDIPELQSGMLMELVEQFLLRHRSQRRQADRETHPETKRFTYLTNNGYGAGRMNTTLADR